MTVQADRSSSFFIRKIEKLVDISQVEVLESADTAAEAPAASSSA